MSRTFDFADVDFRKSTSDLSKIETTKPESHDLLMVSNGPFFELIGPIFIFLCSGSRFIFLKLGQTESESDLLMISSDTTIQKIHLQIDPRMVCDYKIWMVFLQTSSHQCHECHNNVNIFGSSTAFHS